MKYVIDYIDQPVYRSRAFALYFGGMKLGVLDIETTGLSPKNSRFVLGGLLTLEDGQLKVEQFFAETLQQEEETLAAYLEAVQRMDVVLTYNGRHFDYPFMRGRAPEKTLSLPYDLDLYLLVRDHSPVRRFLPNLKQKTVEDFMGLWQHRDDEISGRESVDLYYRYLSAGDPDERESLCKKILLHNHDDVVQLYRLLPILAKTDLHQAMFHFGFPVRGKDPRLPGLVIERITLGRNELVVSGRQTGSNPIDYQCYEWGQILCSARFHRASKRFSIALPIVRQSGLALLDLRRMEMELPELVRYPDCREGFLILEDGQGQRVRECNHAIKLCLERILDQWIIKQ